MTWSHWSGFFCAPMIPETLEGWTLDAIRKIVLSGIRENDLFDFKSDLQSADHQRKIVAAFANTKGGFLVFGVTDQRQISGVDNGELPRDFGSKLVSGIEPAVGYEFGAPLRVDDGRMVFVCHVPRSSSAPHSVRANGATVFYKRSPAGTNVPMSREEILAHRNAPTVVRAGDLALLENEVRRVRERAYEVNCFIWQAQPAQRFVELATSGFIETPLESVLPHVFHRLTGDESLVRFLNAFRERLNRVKAASRAIAQRLDQGALSGPDLENYCGILREQVPDLVMSADGALAGLGRLRA